MNVVELEVEFIGNDGTRKTTSSALLSLGKSKDNKVVVETTTSTAKKTVSHANVTQSKGKVGILGQRLFTQNVLFCD